jgi:nitroreductase
MSQSERSFMEFAQVVRKRFMCRSYEDRDVPEEALERILDMAVRFPSAGHTQPQEFIVIRSEDTKYHLARAALDQFFITEAPVVIVVVSDTRRSKCALRRAWRKILQHRGRSVRCIAGLAGSS